MRFLLRFMRLDNACLAVNPTDRREIPLPIPGSVNRFTSRQYVFSI